MKIETLKRSHLKRNIIIGILVIAIISAVILTFTRAKYRTTQSIPLVNGTINYSLSDLNIIGLYIDGVEAEKLDDNTKYTLDTTNSICTYKDGSTINNLTLNYDSSTKAISISPYTTKGTKCTLYFETLKGAVEVIEETYIEGSSTLAYDEANNLRYIGSNPNNFVYFNCSDYNNPTRDTCELWRIIGVFNNDSTGRGKLIKLIRNASLGTGGFSVNNWSKSAIQTLLNGDYLNGTGTYESNGIKNDTTRNMIQTVTWKLGGKNSEYAPAATFYEAERGTTVWGGSPRTWVGKVGLMYPSDYGYATSGGTTTSREACLTITLDNWSSSSYSNCKNSDWLYNSLSRQWTITPLSSNGESMFYINNSGNVAYTEEISCDIRPSVYLASSVSIFKGSGTSSNPYILL